MKYDFKKQLRSFGYAWKGIRCCIGKEQNLNFHLIATAVVVIAGFVFRHYPHGVDDNHSLHRSGDSSRTVQYRH